MSKKEYSAYEQKFYKTPDQETAFLLGAFQMVSMAGIAVGAGWVLSLAYMIFSDKYFSTPFRDDKDLRASNIKGWAMGLATSFAVIYGVNGFSSEEAPADNAGDSPFEQSAIIAPAPSGMSIG